MPELSKSQDGITTCLRCGGSFNDDFVTDLQLCPALKEF